MIQYQKFNQSLYLFPFIFYTVLTGNIYARLKTKILFYICRQFQWCCWSWRNPLEYTFVQSKLNMGSFSICITYLIATMIFFPVGFKIQWTIIIVDICINLVCGDWFWYGWRLIKGNHSSTTIISDIIFQWVHRAWWYN